jgi:hypothetical protein
MPSTIIENLDLEKPSFGPSKWPRKLKPAKNSKLPKLPESCFEPFGKVGWPPISSWINLAFQMFILVHMHSRIKSLIWADLVLHLQNGGLLTSWLVPSGLAACCALAFHWDYVWRHSIYAPILLDPRSHLSTTLVSYQHNLAQIPNTGYPLTVDFNV